MWVLRVRLSAQEERRSLTAILGRLKEAALEGLLRALETGGAEPGPCCPVPANQRPAGASSDQSEPALAMARVFRGWGESGDMVRLPWCDPGDPDIYTCCNPFHWSRVCPPGEHTVNRDTDGDMDNIHKRSIFDFQLLE